MGQIGSSSSVRNPRDVSVSVEECPDIHLFVNYLKPIETVTGIQVKNKR
jgi:hypothetical protein